MKSKYLCCALLIAFFLSMGFFSDTSAVETINWCSYEEGLVVSKAEKKKVFLHFYADWCVFCAKMAKETFQNPAVVSYLNNNFIPVRVDTDKDPATAMKYGVQGLPSTWFLTEMGEAIGTVPGFIPPEPLLAMLKEVNGIDTGS
ncbi:MAG: thioredoxin family protein [Deltaproteobacteria bacterium]|nr:thioredoxin family protein [Deltaproteobacteria bacterium]